MLYCIVYLMHLCCDRHVQWPSKEIIPYFGLVHYFFMTQPASSLLLCEALGFSPQLLLDDIINIANNAVQDGVNGMEEFLQKWADERASRGDSSRIDAEATIHEVEQGLVAFQTLLEYHTDIAFDFFEAWCLRNIFMIPPDLPIVLPHQASLNLTMTADQEQQLMEEVEMLRRKLDNVRPPFFTPFLGIFLTRQVQERKLNRLLHRSIRAASRQRKNAEARLSRLEPLQSSLELQDQLPPKFVNMYQTLSELPPFDIPPINLTTPGKQQWETNKTGYMNWALGRLMVRGKVVEGDGQAVVGKLDAVAADVGSRERALNSLEGSKRQLEVEGIRSRNVEEDDHMG